MYKQVDTRSNSICWDVGLVEHRSPVTANSILPILYTFACDEGRPVVERSPDRSGKRLVDTHGESTRYMSGISYDPGEKAGLAIILVVFPETSLPRLMAWSHRKTVMMIMRPARNTQLTLWVRPVPRLSP